MSYPQEKWWKWLPHEVIIFTKFQEDRTKIVDFLLMANFWECPFFLPQTLAYDWRQPNIHTLSLDYRARHSLPVDIEDGRRQIYWAQTFTCKLYSHLNVGSQDTYAGAAEAVQYWVCNLHFCLYLGQFLTDFENSFFPWKLIKIAILVLQPLRKLTQSKESLKSST